MKFKSTRKRELKNKSIRKEEYKNKLNEMKKEKYDTIKKLNTELVVEKEVITEKKHLIEILKQPDLLKYVDEALEEKEVNKAVKGEIHSKLTSFMLCNTMNLGNYLMLVFKGSSSIGKTNLANLVTGLFKTKKIGELSPTALKYAGDEKQYHILYHQETSEKESGRKTFKFISSDDDGFLAETTIKNPETGEFGIQRIKVPAKGFVTTTTAIELDKEFATRSFMIPLDESQQQTRKIMEYNLSETQRKMNQIEGHKEYGKKYKNLKKALEELYVCDIVIPFESEIKSVFPTKTIPLRVRRDSKKLITVIKASTLLFQHQRPKIIVNNELLLVSTWQDLYNAIRIAMPIMDATMTGYDSRTKKAIELLPEIILETGGITSENLANAMGDIGKNYAGRILKQLNESGYLYQDNELKKELNIKGKTIVYVLDKKYRRESCNNALQDIDWVKVLEKQQKFLDCYAANSKNHKDKRIVQHYMNEYKRFGRIVYDPVDYDYKKLELDGHEILQFAALTSGEEEGLQRDICQYMGCKKPRQDSKVETPIAVGKIDKYDFHASQFYQEYLEAEIEILKILKNPIHLDREGYIETELVVDIIDTMYEFGASNIHEIIKTLIIEEMIIQSNGLLRLNQPKIQYSNENTLIRELI